VVVAAGLNDDRSPEPNLCSEMVIDERIDAVHRPRERTPADG
jgi:hypothetical protein